MTNEQISKISEDIDFREAKRFEGKDPTPSAEDQANIDMAVEQAKTEAIASPQQYLIDYNDGYHTHVLVAGKWLSTGYPKRQHSGTAEIDIRSFHRAINGGGLSISRSEACQLHG